MFLSQVEPTSHEHLCTCFLHLRCNSDVSLLIMQNATVARQRELFCLTRFVTLNMTDQGGGNWKAMRKETSPICTHLLTTFKKTLYTLVFPISNFGTTNDKQCPCPRTDGLHEQLWKLEVFLVPDFTDIASVTSGDSISGKNHTKSPFLKTSVGGTITLSQVRLYTQPHMGSCGTITWKMGSKCQGWSKIKAEFIYPS